MEKNLAQILPNSIIASEFSREIDTKHKCPISEKIDGSLVIGKAKSVREFVLSNIVSNLNLEDDILVNEYGSVLLNCKVFYETVRCGKKRTDDTFIFNIKTKQFGVIESIFVISNKLYFLLNEKFEIVQNGNQCKSIVYLEHTEISNFKIIESTFVGPKFAYVKFDDIMSCAEFPNMIERN